jgi:Tol biopolymer transport system component
VGFYTANGNNVSWTPDGHIVFISNESGASDVWLMDPDGANRKQLTSKAGHNLTPVVTSDGRYIVFSSARAGSRNIWRMNLDGSNPKRLTSGQNDSLPAVSPDGRWVVYSSLGSTQVTGWKVGIDGGDPVQLTNKVFFLPTISPDGKFVAYLYPESADPFAPPNRIGIISIDGGEPVRSFVFQGSGTTVPVAVWSGDGRSILYTVNNNNVTNIWSQPLDGSAPKQLTDFKDSFMTGFSWSPDGKQLACLRGILLRDAVLITDQQ